MSFVSTIVFALLVTFILFYITYTFDNVKVKSDITVTNGPLTVFQGDIVQKNGNFYANGNTESTGLLSTMFLTFHDLTSQKETRVYFSNGTLYWQDGITKDETDILGWIPILLADVTAPAPLDPAINNLELFKTAYNNFLDTLSNKQFVFLQPT